MTSINLNRINPESSLSIASGQTSLLDTVDSSSAITGSFITAGGAGIAKKLYIGTDLSVGGNIIAGTWNASTITVQYGGTGATTLTSNAVLVGNGTSTIQSPSSITYSSNTLTLPKLVSNDTTDSSSISTGSVILSGGLGVAKNIYTSGTIGLTNATNNLILYNSNGVGAPSFTSRSIGTKIVLSPNLSGTTSDYSIGVELNNLWFDSSATTSGFKWYHGTLNTLELSSSQLHIKHTAASSSITTGALRVSGGVGINGAIYATSLSISGNIISGTWNGSTITVPYGGTGATTLTSNAVLLGNGTSSIQSPSSITFTANTLTLPKITSNDTTASTSNSTGSVLLSGGLGISNATDAISSTNGGTITTAGGVGIAKRLYVGTNIFTGSNVGIGTSTANAPLQFASTLANRIIVLNQTANNDHQYHGLGVQSDILRYQVPSTTNSHIFYAATSTTTSNELGRILGTGGAQFSILQGGSTASTNLVLRSTSNATKGYVYLDETTDSSSVSTGVLRVDGGVGIAKKLYIGGELNLANATSNLINFNTIGTAAPTQTTRSTGTKIVLNSAVSASTLDYGIGIEPQNMWFTVPNGTTDGFKWYTGNSITNIMRLGSTQLNLPVSTDSSSSTTGAFITAGGAGIAKKLYVGGSVNFASTLDMNNSKILNLATPTSSTDAVNKSYVDGLVQGLSTKNSVKAATVVAGTLASSFEDGDTIDGFVLSTEDRILIKDQAIGSQNGIYIVNASGSPTRTSDLPTGSSAAGVYVFVESGTTNGDNGFICTNDTGNDVVNTDALVFTQFSGAGQIDAGTGLTKSGNTLNVDSSLAHVTEIGTITTGTWNASVITVPYGGTGVSTLTSNAVLLGNGANGIQSPSGITFATNTLTLPKITSNDSTASSSNSTGSVLLSGGLGISNTTEATSSTNGGTITTAGGAAIAKKLFIGGDLSVSGLTTITNNIIVSATGESPYISLNVSDGSRGCYSSYLNSNTGNVSYSGLDGVGYFEINTGGHLISTAAGNTNKTISFSPGAVSSMMDITTTGVSINGTTESTSSSSGSLIVAGGVGIAKKLFVGNVLEVDTSSSVVKINTVDVTPSTGDISETSFSGSNNVTSAANVTGFSFANGDVRSFKAICSIFINASVDLYAIFELTGIQKGGSWEMTTVYTGDNSNIIFTITSAGQIQYTSGNETGFVSNTMKFRAYTTSI